MGGAGPMEAAYVISELGLEQAVVPPVPGNFSAFGLITADAIHDFVRTFISPADTADLARLNALYAEMEDTLAATFDRDGIAAEDRRLERTADVRYRGQFHIINVPMASGTAAAADVRRLEEAFHDEHLRLYTYKNDDAPTELVNVRVRGTGIVRRPALKRLAEGEAAAAVVDVRSVYFREVRESRQCTIYKRDLLGAGSAFDGPAIVEEQTSTTLVPPGFHARVDDYANIIISTSGSAET
jgi:N-methylhydantoinase A